MKRKIRKWFPLFLLGAVLSGCRRESLVPPEEKPAAGQETVALTVWGAAEDEELLRRIIDGFLEEYRGQLDCS